MSKRLKRRLWAASAAIVVTATAALSLLPFGPPARAATITSHAVINEVVSNPLTGDEWVEVHDPTGSTPGAIVCGLETGSGSVLATGCGHMTGDFLIRWSSDSIDDSGDTIVLYGSDSTEPIDTVTVPALAPGQSYARSHDGSTRWEIRDPDDVTPNRSNGSAPIDSDPPSLAVSAPLSGDVVRGGFTVSYSASDPGSGVAAVAFYIRDGASTGAYTYHDVDLNTSFAEPFASIETFSSLANGIYDVCVTAIDEEGNGSAGAEDIPGCDGALANVVAIDDIDVRDEATPPTAPTVSALSPVDEAFVPAAEFDLVWDRAIDSSFTLLHQEVTIAASADLTTTPVRYRPTGLRQGVPAELLIPGKTWWWQVALVFARSSTSSQERVVSEVRSFTIEEGAASPTPRFQLNGADWADYRGVRTNIEVCTLEVETFDIGDLTALAEIESYGDGALTTLVADQALHSLHVERGSAGVWIFDLADHPTMAVPGEDGYVLQLRIYESGGTEFGWAEIMMPSGCLPAAVDGSDSSGAGDGDTTGEPGGDARGVEPDDDAFTDTAPLPGTGGAVGWWPVVGAATIVAGGVLLALRRRVRRVGR